MPDDVSEIFRNGALQRLDFLQLDREPAAALGLGALG